MASLRIIRRRLRSIQSTKQIMRAMQLVSGSKFKRSQTQLLQVRAVMEFLDGLLQRVLAATPQAISHPLCVEPKAAASALVIVTSDTGLCGSYNTNLIHLAESHIRRESARPTQYTYIGKKGHRALTKRGFAASQAFLDLAGRPNVSRIGEIGTQLMDQFLAGQVSSVQIVSARFRSAASSKPSVTAWLPAALTSGDTLRNSHRGEHELRMVPPKLRPRLASDDYIFEPSPQAVLQDLLPRWALLKFQMAILEAFTSEHSARMIAMKNATDNAQELLGSLTSQRNRIRQASITKEISEIVGTAEALK
jgi:F-type H+-transporting ATPase subunit gamma